MPHEFFMQTALTEARKALQKGEVPVGAVAVVVDPSTGSGRVIARAHNLREVKNDPLGHAELILLRKLSKKVHSWRLSDVTVYVTLEPCLMCMGALLQARVGKLVFGAKDPKAGACGSLYDLSQDKRLNHRIEVTAGVLAQDSSELLKKFFEKLRKRRA